MPMLPSQEKSNSKTGIDHGKNTFINELNPEWNDLSAGIDVSVRDPETSSG